MAQQPFDEFTILLQDFVTSDRAHQDLLAAAALKDALALAGSCPNLSSHHFSISPYLSQLHDVAYATRQFL